MEVSEGSLNRERLGWTEGDFSWCFFFFKLPLSNSRGKYKMIYFL